MPFWRRPACFTLEAGAVFLLAVSPVSAVVPPEPHDDLASNTAASRPSTTLPASPARWPDIVPPRLTARNGTLPAALPFLVQRTPQFSPAFGPQESAASQGGGFSARLMSRMSHEARRFRRDNVTESWGAARSGRDDDLDSIAEAQRGVEASGVVTRSLHRALDDELDRLARTALGLGPTLDFLQGLSLRRQRAGHAARAGASFGQHPSVSAEENPDRLRGDVGLRLDAHPALLLRARFRSLRGRIELPARGDPARLTLESPIGTRGRAVLSSGLPRDGQGWTTLTFDFQF